MSGSRAQEKNRALYRSERVFSVRIKFLGGREIQVRTANKPAENRSAIRNESRFAINRTAVYRRLACGKLSRRVAVSMRRGDVVGAAVMLKGGPRK